MQRSNWIIYNKLILLYIIYNYIRYFLSFEYDGGIFISWAGFVVNLSPLLLYRYTMKFFLIHFNQTSKFNRKFNRKNTLNPYSKHIHKHTLNYEKLKIYNSN